MPKEGCDAQSQRSRAEVGGSFLKAIRDRRVGFEEMASPYIRQSVTPPWGELRRPIKVLAFSQSPEDLTELRLIARAADWELLTAHSTQSGISLLQKHSIQVAICDRDLPGTDWRTLLTKIDELKKPVNALLASVVTSDPLWREVLQYYGYDLIKKPFEKELVRRIVTRAAWTSYDSRAKGMKMAVDF